MNRKELLVSRLNAYAMEKALIPIIENDADDAKARSICHKFGWMF